MVYLIRLNNLIIINIVNVKYLKQVITNITDYYKIFPDKRKRFVQTVRTNENKVVNNIHYLRHRYRNGNWLVNDFFNWYWHVIRFLYDHRLWNWHCLFHNHVLCYVYWWSLQNSGCQGDATSTVGRKCICQMQSASR